MTTFTNPLQPMTPTDGDVAYAHLVPILTEGRRLPDLGPGTPDERARPFLANTTIASFFAGRSIHDRDMARCCLAGLWLFFDFLDESHRISQEIDAPTGSYWHGIMHRREPDAGNAKYWFRKVGSHPVIRELVSKAPTAGYAYRTPLEFVDWCERWRGSGSVEEETAKKVQLLETQLLFAWCLDNAVS
jgi:hypothetical protein